MSGRFTVTTVANPGLIGQSVCKVIMTATLVATAFALAGHASADIYPYTLEGLRQAIEQCTYEANNKWAFEVIKWREQHPPPDSSPYEHERDAQIERCIKKGRMVQLARFLQNLALNEDLSLCAAQSSGLISLCALVHRTTQRMGHIR